MNPAVGSRPVEKVRLLLSSRVSWLDLVQSVGDDLGSRLGLDEEDGFKIAMALREGLNNAILHGNKCDPAKKTTLKISSSGDTIEIIVEDQGTGFALDTVADPTDMANLLKPNGRGILIIRSFMDEVDLSAPKGGGCRLRMLKRISGDRR